MAQIIDGKSLAKKIRENLKKEAEELKKMGIIPHLAVIMVGDNDASKVYVRNKSRACEEVGIEFKEYFLEESIKQEELIELIDKLNKDKKINGILLQSPIPKPLDIQKAFNKIDNIKDVDGFNPYNVGSLCIGQDGFIPCTPLGIMKMFEEYKIEIEGKKVAIIGRSNIVGKPMAQCMLSKNATVTICHSRTKELRKELKDADIIISAVGTRNIVKEDMVKDGVVVIDVGMNRDDKGKLCGDVDFEKVSKKASYITPVPGGVGPMTIAMLLHNVIKATKMQNMIGNN